VTTRFASSLPWLIAISATLSIAAASALIPAVVEFVFKPLTTVLVILWAWPRGSDDFAVRRWVRAGLLMSLLGDVFLLWPRQGFLPGLVSFLLAHLAYIVAFTRSARLGARVLPFVFYGIVGAGVLGWLWPGVPPPLQLPVLAYVACLVTMAAQAAALWQLARGSPNEILARRAALGGALFVLSDGLLAANRFAMPLPAVSLLILAPYWAAQILIAGSMRRRQ
jgi:uncharacterized membrane protein YhhN